jgi:trehalose/maltose hydrolase-like predicted phosphorylase
VDFTAADRFKTKLHYTEGLNDWSLTWYPRGLNISLDIEMISHANKRRFNIAGTQLLVTARGGNVKVSVTDILDGKSALRSYLGEKGLSDNSTIYISVHPQGLPNVTAWLVSTANVSNGLTDESSRREITDPGNDMTIGQQWDVHLIENQTAIFEKFVGIASTDKFSDAERKAREESSRAFTDGFDVLLSEQAKEWYRRINNHTITSYRDPATGRLPGNDTILAALQIAAVADAYYLNQNLLPAGSGLDDEGVAVSGLTSPSYGGMTFWDQDFYMFPAVVAHWPDHARQMLEVRIKHLSQAKLNAQAQYVQDKYKFDDKSALFSWTAGRTGQATATGPVIDYEVHVNPDIALAAFTYLDVTGDETYFKEKLWPLVDAIGHSISTLLVRDREGYSIYNMTDPDEWAVCLSLISCSNPTISFLFQLLISYFTTPTSLCLRCLLPLNISLRHL